MGFVLSSVFLSLFVETGVQTSLTSQDTRWVGNWWLGFAIFGGFGIFWSLWLFGFPKEFPQTKKRREEGSYTEDVGCHYKYLTQLNKYNAIKIEIQKFLLVCHFI